MGCQISSDQSDCESYCQKEATRIARIGMLLQGELNHIGEYGAPTSALQTLLVVIDTCRPVFEPIIRDLAEEQRAYFTSLERGWEIGDRYEENSRNP